MTHTDIDVNDPIARWHAYMGARDPALLHDLLSPEAVFMSPVVHTPQEGRGITMKYLSAAAHVFGNGSFRYLGEWRAERSAILEFACEIDGTAINGIDMVWWNEAGQITTFKVMVRPLKAMNLLHRLMGEQLMTAGA
jgi:hypothetical protein